MDGRTKAPNVPTLTAAAAAAAAATAFVLKQIMRKMLLVLAFHALKTIYLTGYSRTRKCLVRSARLLKTNICMRSRGRGK